MSASIKINDAGKEIEISMYQIAKQLTPEAVAELLTDWLNGYRDGSIKVVAEQICHQHRTLQQSFIRFFFGVLLLIPKYTVGTDMRNEAGVDLCKDLAENYEDRYLPCI